MASNTTLLDPLHSSGHHSFIPAISHRRKHRNPAVSITLRRRCNHKKHSDINSPVNFRQGLVKNEVSARKLAAGLWQLRFVEVSGDGDVIGDGSFRSSNSKLPNGNVNYQNSEEKLIATKDQRRKPVTILRSRNGLLCELQAFMPFIKSSKEGETKWNHSLNEAFNDSTIVHRRRKILKHRKLEADQNDSIVTVLLEELLRAQRSINKLKSEQRSSKKKVEQNLEEEKVLWKCKEQKMIEKMLDELKDKLARERRNREKMEFLNNKLLRELDVVNESAERFMKNYEKERRKRKLTEEMCDELEKRVGEDKASLEKLMRDSINMYKEVEEEREMMRMTDLWREDRVQMKLADAKDMLEEKYNQMVELIAYLQTFLRSRGDEVNNDEIEGARLIKQVVESVNIRQILELSYNFSKSDDNVIPIYKEYSEKAGPSLACNQQPSRDNDTQISQHRMEGEGSFKHFKLLKEGNSTDHNINPHITRGMQGCIEWPKCIPKNISKVIIPLEERVKKQKSQLQHILKPKAF